MSDFRPIHIPEGVEPGFAHITPCSESPTTQAALDLWALMHHAQTVVTSDYQSNGETGV